MESIPGIEAIISPELQDELHGLAIHEGGIGWFRS